MHKQSDETELIISTFIDFNEKIYWIRIKTHCICQSNFVYEIRNLNTEKSVDFANQMIGWSDRRLVGWSVSVQTHRKQNEMEKKKIKAL